MNKYAAKVLPNRVKKTIIFFGEKFKKTMLVGENQRED